MAWLHEAATREFRPLKSIRVISRFALEARMR
jgi:hypothetical protein